MIFRLSGMKSECPLNGTMQKLRVLNVLRKNYQLLSYVPIKLNFPG